MVMRILYRGPQDTDVCTHPETAPDPGFRTVQGTTAYGFDLDGSEGTTPPLPSCRHQNFSGPRGERGIDNQLYRALGCIKGRRQGSPVYEGVNDDMRQGNFTILIELTGVDDLRNDSKVQVAFYSGQDPMVNNVEGISLSNASLRAHRDRHYHAHARGRIVDGILTTEPVEILLTSANGSAPYHLRDSRFRGELRSDGTIKGLLGGYEDVDKVYWENSHQTDVAETSTLGPMTCPGLYYALRRLADGFPARLDGGECGWISSAYEVEALPAFVIHPSEARQNPVRTEPPRRSWWRRLTQWR
jgi:hypothetical protein